MSEIEQVITSLRALLAKTKEQQQDEKIKQNVRLALQPFAEDIQSLLGQVVREPTKHEWIHLFCRRAERIRLKYNYVSEHEWKRRREALACLLNINGEQLISSNDPVWTYFLTTMNFERTLEERAKLSTKRAFYKTNYNKRSVRSYLQKCIWLHSKIKVHGINITTKDILKRLSLCPDESNLTVEQNNFLQEKLGSLYISLGCSRQQFLIMTVQNNRKNITDSRTFIPSINIEEPTGSERRYLGEILRTNRWVMLLGAPGSGKTSLLRWLTLQYACSAIEEFETVYLNDLELGPVRIPVLIRIGEFTEWLIGKPAATLFDYIGHQTWLGERYMSEEHEKVLKYAVLQGRTLILLDGLDEVVTFEQQARIRYLVMDFISKYVRSHGQVSAFDDTVLVRIEDEYVEEIGKSNQIIITSRFIEYLWHPLKSGAIEHYFLSTLTKNESIHFVKHWTSQIESEVIRRAIANGLTFEASQRSGEIKCSDALTILQNLLDEDNENVADLALNEYFWTKQYRLKHLPSLPMVLSLMCSIIVNGGTLPSQKVRLYHECIRSNMPVWISSCGISKLLSENILTKMLSHLAYYLHRKSGSRLIDEFDLKRFCYVSLKMIYADHDLSRMKQSDLKFQVEAFMEMLKCDVGIVAVSSLAVYGFVHLTFQEYFVALALLMSLRETDDHFNAPTPTYIDTLAMRLVEHAVVPSFREPIVLALGLVSWQLSPNAFDSLCYALTVLKKSSMPFGSLLLLGALGDLVTVPAKEILFRAFHSVAILDCSMVFDSILGHTLVNLLLKNNWLADYLSCESNVESFCKLVLRLTEIPNKGTDDISLDEIWGDETKLKLPKWMTSTLSQQLQELFYIFPNSEYILEQTLRRINMLQDGSICMCKSSLQHYLLQRNVPIWRLHPTIVALIIAVYGGLFRSRGIDELLVKFTPQSMYRDSVLSPMLIEYLDQDSNSEHVKKSQKLITACEQRLKVTSNSDVTIDTIDFMIALICLRGLEKPSVFFAYSFYAALSIALQRFKRILFYLRQAFACIERRATLFSKTIHAMITDFCDLSKRNNNDVDEFLESISIGYIRLTETSRPIILRKLRWSKVKAACVQLPIKLGTVELTDFLGRTPSVLRLLCNNPRYSSDTLCFEKTLRTSFNKAPFSAMLMFVPRSLQPLYQRLIVNNLLKTDDVDEDGAVTNVNEQKVSFVFFLYQVLRCIETRVNLCLCPLVCSLIIPFATKHNLMNYIVALLAELRNHMSFDFKYYPHFAELSTSERVQTAIHEERYRIEHMLEVESQELYDEQLFASAICLMRLCQKYQANEVFHDVCRAVFAIKTNSLRALALTAIWRITQRSQARTSLRKTLLSAATLFFESQIADVSPLVTTLLVVHSFSMKQAFPRLFELHYNALLQSLNEVSILTEDMRAIYAALSSTLGDGFVPSSNMIDCQFRTSVAISRCFTDDMLWSSNKNSRKTILFASLYLIELAVDVQVLRYCFEPEVSKVRSCFAACLSTENWTYSDALTMIEQYEKSNSDLAPMNNRQLQEISKQLHNGEYTIAEVQQLANQLKNHPRLFLFVQQDSLSLAEKGVFTPLIVEIICVSLESSDEQLREQSDEMFKRPLLLPFKLDNLHILMNNAVRYIDKSALHYACMLYNRMKISRLEDLHALLQIEHDRIQLQNTKPHNDRRLSFLRFIGQCEKGVLDYFIQHIHSLVLALDDSTNINAINFEYLKTLIRHGVEFVVRRRPNVLESVTLFSEDTTYRQFLINLLKTCQIPGVREVAAQVLAGAIRTLSFSPNDEFKKQMMIVHEVFWQIVERAVTDEQQSEYTINVLIVCLCSLGYRYIKQPAPLFEPDKSTEAFLIKLRTNHESRLVQDRAHSLLNLYYLAIYGEEGLLQRCDMDAKVVYRLLMYSLQDEFGHFLHRPTVEDKISSLICAHPKELIPMFVDNFQTYMISNEDLTFQLKHPPHTRILAELIRSRLLKKKYCEIVRFSSLGELGFLQALRSASKKWTAGCQKEVLIIAAAFGDLTRHLVDFILEVALRLSGVNTDQEFVALINEVSEREVIDYVVTNLRASSMIQRYIMGEILVHLALKDIVSSFEITNELLDTITDPTSQLILPHHSLGPDVTLSEEMARLLKRLICVASPITPIKEFCHFISQQDIDHDFSIALHASDKAFCSLSNETDSNS